MINKKLEDAVKSYNQQYRRNENRIYKRYGLEKAGVIALKGNDFLDVVVEVSTTTMPTNYFTPEEFADHYVLPKVYGGFRVSYRIKAISPAILK